MGQERGVHARPALGLLGWRREAAPFFAASEICLEDHAAAARVSQRMVNRGRAETAALFSSWESAWRIVLRPPVFPSTTVAFYKGRRRLWTPPGIGLPWHRVTVIFLWVF